MNDNAVWSALEPDLQKHVDLGANSFNGYSTASVQDGLRSKQTPAPFACR